MENQPMRPRRLSQIAAWINANVPELDARIERGFCNTDRKLAGTRLRIAGKGRWGNKLVVRKRSTKPEWARNRGQEVFSHNAAETYRRNDEVERWLREYLFTAPRPRARFDVICVVCRGTARVPFRHRSSYGGPRCCDHPMRVVAVVKA